MTETSEASEVVTAKSKTNQIDWLDIGSWPQTVTDSERIFLVETGPVRILDFNFPVNDSGRHFSQFYYSRTLMNGEVVDRRWIVYSKTCDKVFCFCCRLFGTGYNNFTKDGCNNWQNLSKLLRDHETGITHINALCDWLDCQHRLELHATVDKHVQKQIDAEKMHWRSVLERLLTIVRFLAERNLALRGSVEKLDDAKNGNFLGLVEIIAKFDPVLSEHIRRISNDELADHYLGKTMQNEFIQLLGNEVLSKILQLLIQAKYFSVILDCTPDVSHEEQLTIVLRCVEIVGKSVDVVEHFVGFVTVDDSSGENIAALFLRQLDQYGLSLSNCRGQGYDNGANMRGCNKGVQSRILQLERRAFFMPCGCHSLNLMLCDMAKSSPAAMTFFGVIQKIYVLFTASTQRWSIFKKHVTGLTVKADCDTRWEAKINSVKAVRYQIGGIYDALVEVANTAKDPKFSAEAMSLAKTLRNFTFLVTLVIWYDLLLQTNVVSKLMQKDDMQLDVTVEILDKTIQFLTKYRQDGFEKSVVTATELGEELEMNRDELVFPSDHVVRPRRKRKQFAYEADDESVMLTPEEKFRTTFFLVLMDRAITSFNERFQQMNEFKTNFGFLFNIINTPIGGVTRTLDDRTLQVNCMHLQEVLSPHAGDGDCKSQSSDIDGLGLFDELKTLRTVVPENITSLLELLRYLHSTGLHEVFPNVSVAVRIVLTIPVTVASGERSFSKLKLIKTYLRANMQQDRLNGLALLSIESAIARGLDYSSLITKFASIKARRVAL